MQKQSNSGVLAALFKSTRAAIDLASIMVGIIVIGIIGGVIAATIFAVIPWAQDNAAKASLDAAVTAESAHFGFTADEGAPKFGDSSSLATRKLLTTDDTMKIGVGVTGSCYTAVIKSATGNVFYVTDKNPKATKFTGQVVPCISVDDVLGTTPTTPQVPVPVAAIMSSTWNTSASCATITLPIRQTINATVNWGDGSAVQAVNTALPTHTYTDGLASHTIIIDGQFSQWSMATDDADVSYPSAACLTSVTNWDAGTGTTNLSYAFARTSNVGATVIPSTTTDLSAAFYRNTTFNQSVNNWNVSNVTNFDSVFERAAAFNQPLNNWDVSKATKLTSMFAATNAFNQSLNSWNTSNVTDFSYMFSQALAFNGDVSNWNTAKATNMGGTFYSAIAFNKPLTNWTTTNVTDLSYFAYNTRVFDQPVNQFNTAKVTNMNATFHSAALFNQSLTNWNTANVANMGSMFTNAKVFNQPLATFNTAKVTDMAYMFDGSTAFNQNLTGWSVASNPVHASFNGNGSGLSTANMPKFVN